MHLEFMAMIEENNIISTGLKIVLGFKDMFMCHLTQLNLKAYYQLEILYRKLLP